MQSTSGRSQGNELGLAGHPQTATLGELNEESDVHSTETLPLERAYYWEATNSNRIFLTQPINGRELNWNWGETMDEARRIAWYLKSKQWTPGSRIVILSRNCAWWVMAELAIWMAGHVTVPIYTSLTPESAGRLMEHCDPVACFLGALDNPELADCMRQNGIACIRFPNALPGEGLEWDSAIASNKPIMGNPVRRMDDVATIIYTSGTTGAPKGAMHRFSAFPYFAKAVMQTVGARARHRVLSYLPLAHIAERALTETSAIYGGWHIYFCESAATFMTDLKRARPTVFFSVPRLYTKFQQGVLEKVSERKLEHLLRTPVLNYLVRRRILRGLGLSTVRFAASGSAPIARDLVLWFRKLGLPLTEGYGATETGITHTAPGGESRVGYVGRGAPGVETTISESGEVLLKSPMGMVGYYKDPAATREVLAEDGAIRTGDLGEVDDGWLRLKGRIKDDFKTSKGKYVSPSAIETMLNGHRAVESSLVMGSGWPAPFAIAVLTAETRELAMQAEKRHEQERSFEELIDATNSRLAPHEQLKFLVLVDSKWTIERGFVTPTLKLRRTVLENHYTPFVAEWMARGGKVIWHEGE